MAKAAAKSALVVKSGERPAGALSVDFGEAEQQLAVYLGVDISASPNVRTEQAVYAYNTATRHLVEAGLLLSSVKRDMGQEVFNALIEERGLPKQRAYELMSGAAFAARLPADQREQIMAMPKMKVLALASADPEVVQQMLADGDVDVNTLSVKAMRERIRTLEAAVADREVQLETAEAKAEAAIKANAKKKPGGEMPTVIEDIRLEVAASVQQADLALGDMESLARELVNMIGLEGVYQYVKPTARLQVAGLVNLRVKIDGVITQLIKAHDMVDISPEPMSYLVPSEVEAVALKWADLVALNDHQKALREWERKQARPKGKGRPEAKPEAPKTLAGD
jgi:hypothetical protein